MLKQRIATALVLLGVLIVALTIARPYGFPLFALAMVGIVVSEWLRLLAVSSTTAWVVAAVLMFASWMVGTTPEAPAVSRGLWIASAAMWIALAAGLIASGRFPPSDRWRLAYACVALLLPAACWFALVAAYREGSVFLGSILALVWAADIAAYFAGRAFGRKKLAPAISPGKTWAGAIGGAVAAVIVAVACAVVPAASDSVFAIVAARWSLVAVVVLAVVLVVLCVVGDLFESQLKRQAGVKDSGRLLPGHGGVFDRVDAMLPVVPLAVLIAALAA